MGMHLHLLLPLPLPLPCFGVGEGREEEKYIGPRERGPTWHIYTGQEKEGMEMDGWTLVTG